MNKPPLTSSTAPDTKSPDDAQKNAMALATSSGVPMRRSGVLLLSRSVTSAPAVAVMGDAMRPGVTALQVMP
ncbi:hypothetical protein D3C72_2480730 [compost metagenome]